MRVDLAAQVSDVQMKIDKLSVFILSIQTLHIVIDLKFKDGIWIVSYIGCHNSMATGLKNIDNYVRKQSTWTCPGGEEASETAKFALRFDWFFDRLSVSSLTGSGKKRKIFRMPYRWSKDLCIYIYICIRLSVCYVRNQMSY